MARNIAKRFATMTLLYWKPNFTGSGVRYDEPVEFKGFYMTNMSIFGDDLKALMGSTSERTNFVLFYMLEPLPEGCVSWEHDLKSLEAEGLAGLNPNDIKGTRVIKKVTELPMIGTRKRDVKNLAFIATVE